MKKVTPTLLASVRDPQGESENRDRNNGERKFNDQRTVNRHDEPPLAAVAAPPPRPAATTAAAIAAMVAAGPPARPSALTAQEPAFVPDFFGQTMARARTVAASESLGITTLGAIEGRVVSQLPVPGTLLEGKDRMVRLQFAALREDG